MKRFLTTMLIITLLLSLFAGVTAHADQSKVIRSGDWYYGIKNDSTAIIYEYEGSDIELTVPAELDGYPVSELAFQADDSIVSLTIPEGVKTINSSLCIDCKDLKKVELPDSVTFIARDAFARCTSLTDIRLPEGLEFVSAGLLGFCSSLTEVSLPEGITDIANSAFLGCTSLRSIDIPDSVTSIGSRSFYICEALENVTLGSGLTKIGIEAFFGCTSLKEIYVPSNVTDIGQRSLGYANESINQWSLKEVRTALTIKAPKGSAAEAYADQYDINFIRDYQGSDQPAPGEDNKTYVTVRISDDVYEVETDEQFRLVLYTVSDIPVGMTSGGWKLDGKAFRLIDKEVCYSSEADGALMGGSLRYDNRSDIANFDIVTNVSDESLFAPFIKSFRTESGALAKAYVQPVVSVTMRIKETEGEYTVDPFLFSANAVNGKRIYDLDKGYARLGFEFGMALLRDGEDIPFNSAGDRGDADADGEMTILDATRIQRYLAGLAGENDIDLIAADADLDGEVSIIDATRVQRVLASLCDIDGNAPSEPDKPDDPTEPDVPVITKIESNNSGVVIKWDAFKGAESYRVFIKSGDSWKKLGDTSSTSYTHTDAPYNTKCVYTVRCIDKNGNYTSGFDKTGYANTRLNAPKLKSAKLMDYYIGLSWEKVKGASAYRVYIKGGDYKSWTWIYDSDINYVDIDTELVDLDSNTKYSFTVRCVNKAGGDRLLSGFDTSGVSVKYYDTPIIYGIVTTYDGLELYWTPSKGCAKYRVYEWVSGSWKKLADVEDTALLVTGLKLKEDYRFTVRGLNSKGELITPYDAYGRKKDWDTTAIREETELNANKIISDVESAAADMGFSIDKNAAVDIDRSFVYLLDSTAFYCEDTHRLNEFITEKSVSTLSVFTDMIKRNGDKPSDCACCVYADADENSEIYFYFVFAYID